MIEVLESFVAGKYADPARCEDEVVVTSHHVAVIDGATTEPGHEIDGRAPGRFAMEVLREAIQGLDPDVAGSQALQELTRALHSALAERGVPAGELASACVLIASERRREVWRLGNSTYVVGGRAHVQNWRLADLPAEMRAAYLRALLRAGEGTVEELLHRDAAQDLVAPLLRVEHVFRNAPEAAELAYTAVDGRPVPEEFLEHAAVRAGDEIIFASDGYPMVLSTLAESERYLLADLAEDPLRIGRHPAVRGVAAGMASFDDRAYLRFRIS